MANLNIKNLPEDLYMELRKRAEENRRSLNSEVIVSLERMVRDRPTDDDFYSRMRRIRAVHEMMKDVSPGVHDTIADALGDERP